MDENTNTAYEADDELDAILPDGYAEGDDFFNPDSWTGNKSEDSATEDTTPVEDAEKPAETVEETPAPATEQESETEAEKITETVADTEAPATEQTAETPAPSSKRKVTYQFDHKDVEQEVDLDTDLPELLQKARSLDRYKERVSAMQKKLDRYESTAKIMGNANSDEFLDKVIDTARKSERDDLIAKGTAPALVDDYINRKYNVAKAEETPAEKQETQDSAPSESNQGKRDFAQESRELLSAFPDLRNKQLPQEVFDDAIINQHSLLDAYRGYKEKTEKAEQEKLLAAEKARAEKAEKENRILKQNAASAERAPVTGVTKGGSTQQKADDPFLKGFLAEDW